MKSTPDCLSQKVCASKAPKDLSNLAMSQVSYKERTKSTIATKNCISKVGLSQFPNNSHEPILLMKGDVSQKTRKVSRKTFFLSLPHIQNNSSPLHQKMYCEMIFLCIQCFKIETIHLFMCESKKKHNYNYNKNA